jgi:hypothetical protein
MVASIETLIEGSGGWAYVLAYGYTMGVAIVPFPAEFPAMLNGIIFGPVLGTMITWSAALVGAQISFELSRRFGRPLVARFLRPEALGRADRVVVASGDHSRRNPVHRVRLRPRGAVSQAPLDRGRACSRAGLVRVAGAPPNQA